MTRLTRRLIVAHWVILLLTIAVIVRAGTVNLPFPGFSPNTTIRSAEVNANFAALTNDYNGNISDANIASISEPKITFSGTGHDHSGGTKGALVAMPVVNGRLLYNSATSIKFCPYNGNRLYIKKSGVWTATTIPSGCVTANNTSIFIDGTGSSNLAASTLYYVYLFDNSGTTTIDFSTTGHATDSTVGVETKTAVDTRVLVGMVRTNGSSQFADSTTQRFVLSWFNRRDLGLSNNFTANRSTASGTYVELNTEIRCEFLAWAEEAVAAEYSANVTNDTNAKRVFVAMGYDGTNKENSESFVSVPTAGNNFSTSGTITRTLAEGYHYATLLGTVPDGGTGTWAGTTFTSNTTPAGASSISVKVRG